MNTITQIRLDEVAAWAEYAEAIHAQTETRYEQIEPWAWAKLQAKLKTIDARRGALRRAA